MHARLTPLADPMIAVLLIATALAWVVPATGEARATAQTISSAAIFFLFLVNGMRIARGEIGNGLANWRFFAPLFVWVFGVMALAGWGVGVLAASVLPPLVALGFVYLGVLPSTIQSATSYTTLANGNAALSVVGAALINIAGVFVSAPLFAVLSGESGANIGSEMIVRIGLILVLPFLVGQALQGWTREWIVARRSQVVWLDRIVIGIAVYVAFSGAIEEGLAHLFTLADWAILLGLCVFMLMVATAGAWMLSGLLGYPRGDRIAFLFAGVQKSVAVGAPLAAILFPAQVAGFVIAPLLIYHLIQLIWAAPLATMFARSQG
ncbi:MAG: bile acid:sodium symporter family protein [Erythrobacter sp.]|uniref:bile acid:sodium symporter family protein n=1 Tax=Erythrobacter sp. TaxID=1042 RepID=UPI00263054EB|nr:bile acid:sodium symporter family protein [Erythrobacter sp.]MDJ0977446.1 bile acid:sodium symporter family protein [Erythrobacter sp.]